MELIFKSLVGSKLFGLATPESDTDYKGVFIPNAKDILLGAVNDVVDRSSNKTSYRGNDSSDTDEVYFSLRKYVELLLKGDTTAFDMLHAPENSVLKSSTVFQYLREHRAEFYTKRLDGLFGQVIAESQTYGILSLRATALKEVLDVVSKWDVKDPFLKLRYKVNELPIDNVYTRKVRDETQKAGCQDFYEILDRKYQFTISAIEFKSSIERLWKTYGDRVKKIEAGGGEDWKSLSHAFRIGFQLMDIYTQGDYTFPSNQVEYILNVKKGLIPMGECRSDLQYLISRVKTEAGKSKLPDSIDPEPWNEWVAKVYADTVMQAYSPGKVI